MTLLHTQVTSPIDEWLFLDYLVKIPRNGMVFSGEEVSVDVLKLLSCHGTSPFGPIGTPCGENPVLSDYPNQGITYASIYTPPYFYVTFGLGWVISADFGLADATGWRLTGLMWAAVGVGFFVVVLLKPIFIIGVGAVALYLLAEFVADWHRQRHLRSGNPPRYGLLRDTLIILIVPSVVAWAWSRVVALLAESSAVPGQGTATNFTIVEFLTQFTNFHRWK